jgi:hypothetical protein
MPIAIAPIDDSAVKAQSRAGMEATDIQSASASLPIVAADSWLTTVENVLLMSPSKATGGPEAVGRTVPRYQRKSIS